MQLHFVVTSAPGYATFGQGTGDIFLVYLRCTGNESRLIDCPHNGIGYHSCSHSEDAGVVCACECYLCTVLKYPSNNYSCGFFNIIQNCSSSHSDCMWQQAVHDIHSS